MIIPLGDRVVVVVEQKTFDFLPEHLTKDSLVTCKVIKTPDKTSIPSVGQMVLVPRNALREVSLGAEKMCIVKIRDIEAIIE